MKVLWICIFIVLFLYIPFFRKKALPERKKTSWLWCFCKKKISLKNEKFRVPQKDIYFCEILETKNRVKIICGENFSLAKFYVNWTNNFFFAKRKALPRRHFVFREKKKSLRLPVCWVPCPSPGPRWAACSGRPWPTAPASI